MFTHALTLPCALCTPTPTHTPRTQRAAAEDFDEEEQEALEAENEAEEELYDQVGSCLGSFLKSFGDAALPYVESLMPSIAPLLDKARPDEERRIAMCIIDDMLEHSAQGRAKYLGQVCEGGWEGRREEKRDFWGGVEGGVEREGFVQTHRHG